MHDDNIRPVTKQPNEVFWRWFFVSNWSTMQMAPRGNTRETIKKVLSHYGAEFAEKATVEIIWDSNVEVIPVTEL